LLERGITLGAKGGGSKRAGEVPVVEISGSSGGNTAGDEALVVVTTEEDRRDEDASGDSDRGTEAV